MCHRATSHDNAWITSLLAGLPFTKGWLVSCLCKALLFCQNQYEFEHLRQSALKRILRTQFDILDGL